MKIKNIIKTLAICATASTLASCDDFLSIKPTNEIVLEDFWTEEADVTSVLNSCYSSLASSDCVQRMIVWGELRSDNLTKGPGISNDLLQINKENILETNSMTKWDAFYKVINNCNTVIHYAPGVAEIDPNYTQSELKATIAEATTLRSLAYFYLIRTFRDVPYTTAPSLEDSQPYQIPATKFDDVLDSLIVSMEEVKDDAVRVYGEKNRNTLERPVENTCRVTRYACYALLADLYLWKGNYEKCIEYCDKVIDQKIADYEEDFDDSPTTLLTELYGKYPLISETTGSSTEVGTAYTEIFGTGNSFESVFELSYARDKGAENGAVANFYGSSTRDGSLSAPVYLFNEVFEGTNKYFTKTDCRVMENMEMPGSSSVNVQKYVRSSCSYKINNSSSSAPKVTATVRTDNYANWIIYRLTDVMLMRAEAEVELAGDVEQGATPNEMQTEHYRNAFACVSAVWKRANNMRLATRDTLVFDDYAISRTAMEDLVLNERQRELMFEGKRWFDLVRLARRDGSNTRLVNKVVAKVEEDLSAIKIKLSSPDALYMPYNRDELKQNPYLVQNPAYETDKFEKNDKK